MLEWSAPGAIAIYGMGVGPQIGVMACDLVVALNAAAVEAFCRGDSVALGTCASIALGSYGRVGKGRSSLKFS